MRILMIIKKIRTSFFLVWKSLFLLVVVAFLPFSFFNKSNNRSLRDIDNFKDSYRTFETQFFELNKERQIYRKNQLNDFVSQILDYFSSSQKTNDDKSELIPDDLPSYRDLLNLLPRNWTNLTRTLPLRDGDGKLISTLLFNLIFQTNPDYKFDTFAPFLIRFLKDVRSKINLVETKTTTQMDDLFTINDKEFEAFESIIQATDVAEKQIKIIDYLKKIFKDFGLINNENKLQAELHFGAHPLSPYSSKFPLRIDLEENENTFFEKRITLNFFKSKLDLQFQMVPIEIKITLDKDFKKFNYYSLLQLMMKLIKLHYFAGSENDQRNKQQFTQQFVEWTSAVVREDTVEPITSTNVQDSLGRFLFEELRFDFTIDQYDKDSKKSSKQEPQPRKEKTILDLFFILSKSVFTEESVFTGEGDNKKETRIKKTYIKFTTKKCNESSSQIPLIYYRFTGYAFFRKYAAIYLNEDFGGLCPIVPNEESPFSDGEIVFELSNFYDALFNFIDKALPGPSWLRNLAGIKPKAEVNKLINNQLAKLFGTSLKLDQITRDLLIFEKEVQNSFQTISNFDPQNVEKDNLLASWTSLVYDVFKQNSPVIDGNTLGKLEFFSDSNEDTIRQLLRDDINRPVPNFVWQDLNFEIEDLFLQKVADQKFLVFMVNDRDLQTKKYMFAFSNDARGDPKIVYYASNHYEHLFNQFLSNHYLNNQEQANTD